MIFNLFGDYLAATREPVATGGLLEVLALLDISQRAARSTLSRMKRRGWLRSERAGRRSLYGLSAKGRRLLQEGGQRLFGPPPGRWDGSWNVITYSLPSQRRLTRHRLRTRLSWLGYGTLQPGTLIAANSRTEEVEALLRELEVHPYVHCFAGARLSPPTQDRVVARCWDLPAIDARYADFVRRYAPRLQEARQRAQHGDLLEDWSFVERFRATSDYSVFPRIDPFLPAELLPRHWRGGDARQLLTELRALLQRPAEDYLRTTLFQGRRPGRPPKAGAPRRPMRAEAGP